MNDDVIMNDKVTLVTPDREPWTHERDNAAWARIGELCEAALCAVWDGCHKIYLCMDKPTEAVMSDYPHTAHTNIYDQIEEWWCESCPLVFVNAVQNGAMTNDDFDSVLPQLFTMEVKS